MDRSGKMKVDDRIRKKWAKIAQEQGSLDQRVSSSATQRSPGPAACYALHPARAKPRPGLAAPQLGGRLFVAVCAFSTIIFLTRAGRASLWFA